jgi:hypothetical protein
MNVCYAIRAHLTVTQLQSWAEFLYGISTQTQSRQRCKRVTVSRWCCWGFPSVSTVLRGACAVTSFATPLRTEWNETVTDLATFGLRNEGMNLPYFLSFYPLLKSLEIYLRAGSTDSLQLKLAINKGASPSPLSMFTLQNDRDYSSN